MTEGTAMAATFKPKLNVIDIRRVVDNIFAHVQTVQADVYSWLGVDLPPIKKYYTSAAGRLTTIFPALMVLEKQVSTDPGDILAASVALIFEFQVEGPDTDQLVSDGDAYGFCLETMLMNLPPSVFDNPAPAPGFSGHQPFWIDALETKYVLQQGKKNADAFGYIEQISVAYRLTANIFNQ